MKTPYNFVTKSYYNGSNQTLRSKSKYNAFATFKQITGAGYKLNKGAKGQGIFCGFKPVDYIDENNKIKTRTAPISAVVFDIADTTAMQDKKLLKQIA